MIGNDRRMKYTCCLQTSHGGKTDFRFETGWQHAKCREQENRGEKVQEQQASYEQEEVQLVRGVVRLWWNIINMCLPLPKSLWKIHTTVATQHHFVTMCRSWSRMQMCRMPKNTIGIHCAAWHNWGAPIVCPKLESYFANVPILNERPACLKCFLCCITVSIAVKECLRSQKRDTWWRAA